MADPNLKEVNKPTPIGRSVGWSGLRNTSGYIREEFIPDLMGRKGRETYFEMSHNDAVIGAVLYAIKNILRSVKWEVTASDPTDNRAVEAAELVEGMLFEDMDISWPDTINSVCSMFQYGFSVHEVIFKQRKGYNRARPWLSSRFEDGLYGIQSIASRSQRSIDRWIYDDEEHLRGFVQSPVNKPQVAVPLDKCLHFRTTTELDTPEGKSVLRNAYRSWYYLKRMQEIEAVGTERDLVGYPVLKVPGEMLAEGASPEQVRALASFEAMLSGVRRDTKEGIILPSDHGDDGNPFYTFELMSTGGSRQLDINQAINRYERRIAMSVLADFIFLGTDGSGSLALGSTKTKTFATALGAFQQHIASVFNNDLIPMIWRVNGLDDEIMPELSPGDLETRDLAELGAYIKSLSEVGYDLATDERLENDLRQTADLPPVPNRAEIYDEFGLPVSESGMALPPQMAAAQQNMEIQREDAEVRQGQAEEVDAGNNDPEGSGQRDRDRDAPINKAGALDLEAFTKGMMEGAGL